MRKQGKIEIDKRVYKIYEIRPKDLMNVFNKAKGDGGIKAALTEMLVPLLTDATVEELADMYPSDLEEFYRKLKEVNASFFKRLKGLTQHPEVKKILNELGKSYLEQFSAISANLFSADTDAPSSTGGDST